MIQLYSVCLNCPIFPDICHGGKNECEKVKEWKNKENKNMKYRKKPVVIEAYITDKECFIETLEGTMKADVGDYIITGVNGEQYPCKPDIFEKTYDKVDKEI